MTYEKEFLQSKKIIKQAYRKIIKNKVLEVTKKQDNSLVTNIDVATEKYLIEKITAKFPMDHFLTEEGNNKNKLEDRTWVIDPIDGTTNFSNGVDVWSIQLAFVDKGEVQFAMMYFPKLKRFYTGYQNVVKLNGKILTLNECSAFGSIVHYTGSIKKNIEDLRECYQIVRNISQSQLYCGCASFAFSELISGKCSCVITYNLLHEWDYMPGEYMFKLLGFTKHNFKNYKNGTLILYSRSKEIVNAINVINQK